MSHIFCKKLGLKIILLFLIASLHQAYIQTSNIRLVTIQAWGSRDFCLSQMRLFEIRSIEFALFGVFSKCLNFEDFSAVRLVETKLRLKSQAQKNLLNCDLAYIAVLDICLAKRGQVSYLKQIFSHPKESGQYHLSSCFAISTYGRMCTYMRYSLPKTTILSYG